MSCESVTIYRNNDIIHYLLISLPHSVTQMIQDTVCVVLKDDMTSCVNQDVLFLGLSQIPIPHVVLKYICPVIIFRFWSCPESLIWN